MEKNTVRIDAITIVNAKEIELEISFNSRIVTAIFLELNGIKYNPTSVFPRVDLRHNEMAESIFNIPAQDGVIYVKTIFEENHEKIPNVEYGEFTPISCETKNGFYEKYGVGLQAKKNGIVVFQCGKLKKLRKKIVYNTELLFGSMSSRRALFIRTLATILRISTKKKIMIIHDRFEKADDNGEAFLRWLIKERINDAKPFFVLSKNSPDYPRLKKVAHILKKDSLCYRIWLMASDYVIESAGYSELRNFTNFYRDLSANIKYVFLQHGVIYNNIAPFMSRYERNFSYIVTSAEREQKHIAETPGYYHPLKNVWLTGLPRFDFLYHDEQKIITIMPSWRAYLKGLDIDGFKKSVYYQKWKSLLEDGDLKDLLIKHGYRLQIKLHPNMQEYANTFRSNSYIVADETVPYRKVFAESNLIITDYSSAVFDFLYLRKPVVYYQFDKNEFYGGSHTTQKGYLDLEKDGFGEVVFEHDEIVKIIDEYMETGCTMKNLFRQRVDSFFAYNDSNSCERLYNKLIEVQSGEI